MNVVVNKSIAEGVVKAPPSKSILHRYLISAALAEGVSHITNISFSKDILATIECIKELGADVLVNETEIVVSGIGGKVRDGEKNFQCNESGSTLRFFIPLSMLSNDKACFYGSERLLERPQSVYEALCREQNILFKHCDDHIETKGLLKPDTFSVLGNISSQFITGLLFTLPLLCGPSRISIIPPVESRSYINLTLQAMREFGIKVEFETENIIYIEGNQHYIAKDVETEGDYSNAAFLDAFNEIGGSVLVNGLNEYSLQGDSVYRTLFNELSGDNAIIDISDCPDLGPILFTIAALKNGAKFVGTRRLQIKESDRGKVMCEELAKFGVKSIISDDFIEIYKSELKSSKESVFGHNDHRIVMSFAVLLSVIGGKIEGAEAVTKSFPDFFDKIESLGVKIEKC